MKIADRIHRIGDDPRVNAYLVEDAGEVTIIDAAMPGFYDDIPKELAAMGRAIEDVRAVVLTHGHSDHLGLRGAGSDRAQGPGLDPRGRRRPRTGRGEPEQPDGQDPPRAASRLPVAGVAQRRPQAAGRQGRLDLRRRGHDRRAGQPAGDARAGPHPRQRGLRGWPAMTPCS